jgi:hypothetical protein
MSPFTLSYDENEVPIQMIRQPMMRYNTDEVTTANLLPTQHQRITCKTAITINSAATLAMETKDDRKAILHITLATNSKGAW